MKKKEEERNKNLRVKMPLNCFGHFFFFVFSFEQLTTAIRQHIAFV